MYVPRMDRQPGHQNKAEVIGYRNKYTSFEQHHEKEEDQQSVNEASPESSTAGDEVGIHPKRLCCRVIEDSTETVQDDEDANMADAPAALEKQDHDTARDDENDNGNNSNGNGGHCQNGNAKDIDENDPISSLLRKENEDDPFAWEFESDRIYEGPAVSPPAHVLFAFNHVEEAQRLDIPERPDSKTVWFERMSAAQRQALLSCKLPRDQIAQAFARMKDRIQMEALQDKKLPDTQRWRSGQAAMRFPLSLQSPMAFAPPGSSTYSLQCGIKFAMDPEPWKFGHEMERDEPRHVKKWQEQQQQEQAKRHQKYQQRDLQHRHRHQLPQLDAIIPPHLGPVNPATSVTAPGGLGFPTSNELPWLAFSGTSLAGTRTHPLGIMGCEGRTIPPRPMRSLYRSQSPFVRYAQLGRQQHLHPRISADDYFDRWSRVNIWEAATGSSIPRDATLLASRGERSTPYRMHPFATGAQRASPEEDSRKPSSLMGWNGNLFGYRDDDNPVMQVDNGVDWEVANEAKKRNLSHTKSQNKENASYSEASEKKSGEREGHATAAIDTDETNNGKDNTAVDGPSQPNKNKTSSRILGPGAVNPSSSSSGVNVDANMDVDVDADKLEALKHSKMAPWEASE
ncbi:hypothetical protein SLS62_001482 [Diatrype stigma]|uniref:Uncharacterized protein n=1 Tax=Diatrype stigma TaxID=117547 RepID=A0AAN9UWA9_9PEZI